MIKKIICDFEDVKDFEEFYLSTAENKLFIKVPFVQHKIKANPVPGESGKELDWKANAYQYVDGFETLNGYIYFEPNTEVILIPNAWNRRVGEQE